MKPPQLFVDGKPVRIGDRIGKGGEGEVFALGDGSGRAVKFYTVPDAAQRESKIAAMVRLRLAQQSTLVAFPIEVVRDRHGQFAGFLMNLVRDHKPLFELYSPGARKQNFPEADYRFLVRAALNTACGVASVHKAGCVIGDINHSGVLISREATAALIDADSFQVIDGRQRYLCRVGVPEYTPPELQGLNLGSVVRTPNHDAFGLAIAVFQLLAMGRHPFVGAYNKGDLPIQRAIAEHRFAYSQQRNVGMTAPPGACSLDDFPKPVAVAFEAAFDPLQKESRPSAAQWVSLLEEYERSLRVCPKEKLHHFSTAAPSCPWCRMEGRLGVILFFPTYSTYAGAVPAFELGSGGFSLSQLWAQIDAIKIPSRSQLAPSLSQPNLQPSAEARASKHKQDGVKAASYLAFALAVIVLFSAPQLTIVSIGLVVVGFVLRSREIDASTHLRQKYLATESQWDTALENWEARCGIDKIESLKRSLVEAKQSFQGLAREETEAIAQHQVNRRGRQLESYLEGFHIRRVKISGIGPSKEATLASYGIESAADVDRGRVLAVPGFGPVNSRPLFEWRDQLTSRFVYNPQSNAADQAAINNIRVGTARKADQLRQKLISGAKELWQAAQACDRMLKVADPVLHRIEGMRCQIKADFAYLGIAVPARPKRVRTRTITPQPAARAIHRTGGAQPTTSGYPRATSATTPSCPRCGNTMVKRTTRKKRRRRGSQFWGCSRFPTCRGTRAI